MTHKQVYGNEDCGLIFGSQIKDDLIRINRISESCCDLKSASRCSCSLDVNKANILINDEFEKSNHTRFYVGEWHTHPEDNPSPSYLDLASLEKSYNMNKRVVDNFILMAILGHSTVSWRLFDGSSYSKITPKLV